MIRTTCLAAVLTLTPTCSWACQPLPKGAPLPTATEAVKNIMSQAHGNFVGKVEAVRAEPLKSQSARPSIIFKVLEQYEGKPVSQVTLPMEQDSNCRVYELIAGKVQFVAPIIIDTKIGPISYYAVEASEGDDELEAAFDNYLKTRSIQ